MNRIDVVLAVVLALFALRGFWRGFSREIFALIGLVGGVARRRRRRMPTRR